ncbi:hypothetical protein C7M84_016324 [Penaeus vannamei]|uniref:Uncharacterized protein n=1 Tax=Penaeus vannamei TaxID=6689 RepID=A0A423SN75_PENVA|nr:hypothetical protein C7M84_016324 [Penaeus vannamei]
MTAQMRSRRPRLDHYEDTPFLGGFSCAAISLRVKRRSGSGRCAPSMALANLRAPPGGPGLPRGPLHGVPDLAEEEADGVGVGGAGAGSSDQKLRRQPLAPEAAVGLVADDASLGRGRAEVDDGDAERLVQHDVVGLEVVVDEALGVDLVHTAAHLHGDVHRLGLAPPASTQGLLQRGRARARDEHGCRLSAQPQGQGGAPRALEAAQDQELVLEVLVAAALAGLLEHGLLLAPADEPRLAVAAASQELDAPRRIQEADLLRRHEPRSPLDADVLPLASGRPLAHHLDPKGGGRRGLPPPHALPRGLCGSFTAPRGVLLLPLRGLAQARLCRLAFEQVEHLEQTRLVARILGVSGHSSFFFDGLLGSQCSLGEQASALASRYLCFEKLKDLGWTMSSRSERKRFSTKTLEGHSDPRGGTRPPPVGSLGVRPLDHYEDTPFLAASAAPAISLRVKRRSGSGRCAPSMALANLACTPRRAWPSRGPLHGVRIWPRRKPTE